MARGKKTTEQDKEKLKAVIYLNPDAPKVEWSRQSGIPESTVHEILKDENFLDRDAFEEARARKKEEFIDKAWNVVKKALTLAERRFDKALDAEEKLDALLHEISTDRDMTQKEKNALISQLRAVEMANIRDVAIALGTIYDKQALASGEPTQISESKEPLEDLIKKYEKNAEKLKKLVNR